MISRFLGAILLQFLKPIHFLIITSVLAILGMGLLLESNSVLIAQIAIFIVGLGAGNLFPLIFSIAINKMPDRANEISGLLIMAIVGGAIIPPIMGILSSTFSILWALYLLILCFVYVLVLALKNRRVFNS